MLRAWSTILQTAAPSCCCCCLHAGVCAVAPGSDELLLHRMSERCTAAHIYHAVLAWGSAGFDSRCGAASVGALLLGCHCVAPCCCWRLTGAWSCFSADLLFVADQWLNNEQQLLLVGPKQQGRSSKLATGPAVEASDCTLVQMHVACVFLMNAQL
jgi:hypothetical protein